jgi:signal transduction histidine kinase
MNCGKVLIMMMPKQTNDIHPAVLSTLWPQHLRQFAPALLDETLNPWLRILTQMGQGMMLCDAELMPVWMNETLQNRLGLNLNSINSLNAPGLLATTDLRQTELLEEACQHTLITGELQRLSLSYKPLSKLRAYFEISTIRCDMPPSEQANSPRHMLAIVFNDHTQVALNEKMRRDFVANVSHELRTPLAVIKGYAETLLSGALQDVPLATDFIRTIEEHTDRLSKLVEELLDLSRFETEHFSLPMESSVLDHALERVIALGQARANEKGIRIIRDASLEKLPKAMAHLSSLEQVWMNLIENAIKYSPNQTRIELSLVDDGHWLTFCVKDEGIGIEAKFIPRLFERFYRVDKTRSRHLGGTGLGLSIVKHIMQAHEGDIWVESEPGKGSRFYFKVLRIQA